MKKNKNVAVLADTWLINKKLAGEGVTVTLPSIEWLTQSIKAGGNIDIPLIGMTDALDCNVTTDGGVLVSAIKPGLKSHEFRWAKEIVQKDGTTKTVGCKAFLKMMSKNIPEQAVEEQEAMESSYDYSVSRYQLYEDGKEKFLYDKLAGTLRIDGKDYGKKIKNLLY